MNNEAGRALRIYMAYLSEEGWCAGWVSHLEFTLWEQVLKWRAGIELSSDEESDGSHWAKDAQALSWLAEQAGGWWQWPRDGSEPEFVALKDWQRIFEEHRQSTGDADQSTATKETT